MIRRLVLLWLLALPQMALPQMAVALDLSLPPSARQTAGENLGLDSYGLPTGPFDGTEVPIRRFKGYVLRQSWRLDASGVTPFQVIAPLQEQLDADGYTTIFECADQDCGGFDFRFATTVIDAPAMFVDLDDFRFLSAIKGDPDSPSAAVSMLVSRRDGAAFVQLIQISVDKAARIEITKGSAPIVPSETNLGAMPATSVAAQLSQNGHAILGDLEFQTGSSNLGAGPFASLSEVSLFLADNPDLNIALVGHTDAVGGLEGNITLSQRRANSVRDRLIEELGAPADRLTAQGVGYLAPVASNQSNAGRDANRRVEAVVVLTP
jgi:outer membrane protein OmpA-like peptidoglycan-associated protein